MVLQIKPATTAPLISFLLCHLELRDSHERPFEPCSRLLVINEDEWLLQGISDARIKSIQRAFMDILNSSLDCSHCRKWRRVL